jgi:hypothetical protein
MMEPNADVVAGFQPVMPSYVGVLTPGEVGALVELIRSLKDAPLAPSVALPRLSVAPLDAGALEPGNAGEPTAEPLPVAPRPPAPDSPTPDVVPPIGPRPSFPTRPPRPSPEEGRSP